METAKIKDFVEKNKVALGVVGGVVAIALIMKGKKKGGNYRPYRYAKTAYRRASTRSKSAYSRAKTWRRKRA